MSELGPRVRLGPLLRMWVGILATIALVACAASPGESGGAAGGWTQVTASALAGLSLLDVGPFGAGFAAVGNAPDSGGTQVGEAVVSSDGASWTAAATTPFKSATVTNVGAVQGGLLALGDPCSGECGGLISWRSKDGVEWSGPTSSGSQEASRPAGFVDLGQTIVAAASELLDPATNAFRGLVFLSTDGSAWHEARDLAQLEHSAIGGIASDGKGIVIVGGAVHADGSRDGAAWTSTDGQTWTAATDDGSFKAAIIQSVAHGSAGYVAVGSIGADGGAWLSTDGSSWTRVAADVFKSTQLVDVASAGAGYVAIARTGSAAWASSDGKSWRSTTIPGAPDARLVAVTVGTSRSAIVGQAVGGGPSGLMWLGPLP
jgi:hypothetical protein